MRMRTTVLLMGFLFLGLNVNAQEKDPKAKAVLDEVSKKIKSYNSFAVEFTSTLKASSGASPETQSGKAIIKGDKYIVEIGGQKIINDGKSVYTIVIADKEVYVNEIEEGDDDLLNPSKMFTIWEKDFKYKYIKEETIGGVPVHEIHLYPVNPAKSKYHTIIVKINKAKSELHSVIVKGKEGEVLSYTLTKFTANPSVTDDDFKFVKAKYPGYTIIR